MREKHDCSPPWFLARLVRRREASNPRDPAASRGAADLSPYSPLPAIGSRRNSGAEAVAAVATESRPPPPPLLRQDTYVVDEPLVVKGPRRRKLVRGEAWGGHRTLQTTRHTSGGTCFSVPAHSEPTQPTDTTLAEGWRDPKQDAPEAVWTDGSVRHKAGAEAYWFQC